MGGTLEALRTESTFLPDIAVAEGRALRISISIAITFHILSRCDSGSRKPSLSFRPAHGSDALRLSALAIAQKPFGVIRRKGRIAAQRPHVKARLRREESRDAGLGGDELAGFFGFEFPNNAAVCSIFGLIRSLEALGEFCLNSLAKLQTEKG